MLRLGITVLGVDDLERATAFWSAALGLTRSSEWENENWRTLSDQRGPVLGLIRSETPVQRHPRLHLDLFADSRAEQEAEVARLVSLGATEVDWDRYPADPDFVVLADPEGNIFCVVDLSHAPSS
ncbi:VOC family protein [Amycolatopsis viridis]|uniref:Catechol 2,3-dioxygenase-like lactoylglutathione lyase family enzyme n=1 Tax=Amycolatopsis viridis TaxID=185678 RepID=A0ABX0T001_9PSEU|nr:VOC family protein [Amycolatopsis viridis]NIH82547.1 catechol 2,3-dioxygenase-like lactoylglutathione lyase family enzyme [Amycolatopsis viridis]